MEPVSDQIDQSSDSEEATSSEPWTFRRVWESLKRRRPQWLPLTIFLLLVLIYNSNGRFIAGSDVYSTRFMPINLALRGTYYFDPEKPYHLGTVVNDPESPSHGKMISVYPTYTPTLLLPIYVPLYRWFGVPEEHYLAFYLDKFISSLFAAGASLFTFLLLRRLHGGRIAFPLLVTAAMGLGTSLWAIASQGSWAHGPSAFYLIFAVWALVRTVDRSDRKRPAALWAWLAGWAIASAFATRQSNIFFVLPFFILALWELRRARVSQAWLIGGILPVAAWFTIHNWVYFGNPLTSGYNYNLARLRIPNLLHYENFFAGFFGLLFSPSLGMFTMGPVTLFALPGMVSLARRWRVTAPGLSKDSGVNPPAGAESLTLERLMQLGVIFIVAHTLFYSCYLEWWAGWSFCYRYLIDIQPFIALCIGWFFRPGARGLKFRWPLFMPALALSIAVQFYGAFFWGGRAYGKAMQNNQRLYLDLSPDKSHAGVFNHPSVFFSLAKRDHYIMSEMDSFRWDVGSWKGLRRPFTSREKVFKDLFETRVVRFKPTVPIILYQGQ